jgi:hypothetical protein
VTQAATRNWRSCLLQPRIRALLLSAAIVAVAIVYVVSIKKIRYHSFKFNHFDFTNRMYADNAVPILGDLGFRSRMRRWALAQKRKAVFNMLLPMFEVDYDDRPEPVVVGPIQD